MLNMIYKILDDKGNVINRIIATKNFVDAHHSGRYQLEGPAPKTPKLMSKVEVITLLGSDYVNIINESKSDVEVEVWVEKFRLTDAFYSSDPNFISDIHFLVTKNLITQQKANTILDL